MKRKLTLLLIAAVCVFGLNGQIVLTQNFNATSSVVVAPVTATSWVRVNNSQPVGNNSWFMGNPGVFTAYNGADSAYFAANFFSTLGTGTISSWLISPTVSLANGGVFEFATRTTSATVNPDRLELYVSTGTGTNVGTTATSVGTFSLQLAVNPSLTANGYPGVWTIYSTTLSTITGTTPGRFAFRYNVPNGGPTGANSNYIGIDAVEYRLPCANPTLSIASSTNGICSGDAAVISATGATTYTWSNGATSPSITVSPTATTVYTVTGSSIPNCNSTQTIAISATLTPNLSAADMTTCPGTAATLMVSGATTYSWDNGSTSTSIVVTPTTATDYTVTGYNGNCTETRIVSVALGASLSINATASSTLLCAGKPVTLTAMGATAYSWSPGTSTLQTAVFNPTASTVYTLTASSGTCMGMSTISITTNPAPAMNVLPATPTVVCTGAQLTFSASGAPTYSWTNSNSTASIISVSIPTVSGTYSFAVVGTGTNGCSSMATVTRSVDVCAGIATLSKEHIAVSVYPNPFGQELRISAAGATKVEFYNSLGQMVATQSVSESEAINTSEMAKGIYILKVYNSDEHLIGTIKAVRN